METLLIHLTHDNTLPAGEELLLDALLVQLVWNSTRNGMLVCLKENSRLLDLLFDRVKY